MRGRKPCIHQDEGFIKGESAANKKTNPKTILMEMMNVLEVLLSQCLAITKSTKLWLYFKISNDGVMIR
ncbi:MAG: hypothetical protein RL596_1949 [Bacteroidota bacterium]